MYIVYTELVCAEGWYKMLPDLLLLRPFCTVLGWRVIPKMRSQVRPLAFICRGEVATSSGMGSKHILLFKRPTENPVYPAIVPVELEVSTIIRGEDKIEAHSMSKCPLETYVTYHELHFVPAACSTTNP